MQARRDQATRTGAIRGLVPALGIWLLCAVLLAAGCASQPRGDAARSPGAVLTDTATQATREAFLDTLQARTFRFFWDRSDPRTGLMPDRWPTHSFMSVSATGFALTAYPIGVEHAWITRDQARARVVTTLRFFRDAPQDSSASGAAGFHGFYYHFLDSETGLRFRDVELSTVDTALLLAGALFCQSYFDQESPEETELRALVDTLYARADWSWAQVRPPTIGHGWDPEGGHLPYDWRGYNEAMITYLVALSSPTHPLQGDAWSAWLAGYRWGEFQGEAHLGFAPLFGHQFTHCWVDFRGIQDDYMRGHDLDYFENTRRAVMAQRSYAIANPGGWRDYGPLTWGLSACDGPVEKELVIDGRTRQFHTYWARGASFTEVQDDGTIAPTAAGASVPFAPELAIPALMNMRATYGERLFSTYGFLDAFNPTFRAAVPVQHGAVDPKSGWFDTDYLGIDQGPILIMVENYRTGLVWKTMRKNEHLVRGLRAARFTGGWLDSIEVKR